MRRPHILTAVGLLGVLAVAGWSQVPGNAQPAFTGADIAEIQQLYVRYNQGLDFQDEELYLSAWADDAVLTGGDGIPYAGLEEIRTRFRNPPPPEGRTLTHNNTSSLITPTADGGAKGRTYWMVIDVNEAPPRIMAAGYYFDTFKRTPDGWRIATRGSQRGWDWRLESQ
jgi:hypothetical protein